MLLSSLPPLCKAPKITIESEKHNALFPPARLVRLNHKPTGMSSFLKEKDAICYEIQKGNWGIWEAIWVVQHHQESLGWSLQDDSYISWACTSATSLSFQTDCVISATDALQTVSQETNACLLYPKCEMHSLLPCITWELIKCEWEPKFQFRQLWLLNFRNIFVTSKLMRKS